MRELTTTAQLAERAIKTCFEAIQPNVPRRHKELVAGWKTQLNQIATNPLSLSIDPNDANTVSEKRINDLLGRMRQFYPTHSALVEDMQKKMNDLLIAITAYRHS